MRLIDADALLSKCKLAQKQASYDRQYANAFYSASGDISTEWWCVEDIIEDAPTIEPERQKGEWIPHKSIFGGLDEKVYTCNQCGCNIGFLTGNFCPRCGSYNGRGEADEID